MEEKQTKFETFAMVELFGHNQIAGKVTEQVIAGQTFIRIDVPKTSTCPSFTKYYLPTAIYSMTPVEEDYCNRMAGRIEAQPINDYRHNDVITELIKERLSQMAQKGLM